MEALEYVVMQAEIVKAAQTAGVVTPDYKLTGKNVKADEALVPAVLKILESHGVPVPAQADALAGSLPMLLQLLGVPGA